MLLCRQTEWRQAASSALAGSGREHGGAHPKRSGLSAQLPGFLRRFVEATRYNPRCHCRQHDLNSRRELWQS